MAPVERRQSNWQDLRRLTLLSTPEQQTKVRVAVRKWDIRRREKCWGGRQVLKGYYGEAVGTGDRGRGEELQ